MVSLLETKLDDDSLLSLKRKMGFYPSSIISPEARICLLWNPDQMDIQIHEVTRQFIHCSVLQKQSNKRYQITSVYASNSSTERMALWDSIRRLSGSIGAEGWIVGGDFNEVRFNNEKVGGRPVLSRRLHKFNSCIMNAGLEDLKSIGHTLSWSNRQDSRIMCRLDRIMGNQSFISSFPHSLVEYLPPGISDHSPMKVILEPAFPSGPRPFKYFVAWEDHPSFQLTVQEAWREEVQGNPMYRFVKWLANIKSSLKKWNKEVFGSIHSNLSICKRELEDAQTSLQCDPQDPGKISAENDVRKQYSSLLTQEEQFARQKFRQLWLAAGDSNTKFFYNSIKSRSARNTICRLRSSDGELCADPDKIKELIVTFYRELLNRDSDFESPVLPALSAVSPKENEALCSIISEEDLRSAIFQMKAQSSPGLDGFPARFYQVFWPLIKDDLLIAINFFFHRGKLLRQVDLKKAFDSVQWPYLEKVLRSYNFSDQWIALCMECVTMAKYSVLINGTSEGFFSSSCGLRQGDPLSPLLFTLVMESFSARLNQLVKDGKVGPYIKGELNISHLCFADDLLVFSDSKLSTASTLTDLFDSFARSSGLHLNNSKMDKIRKRIHSWEGHSLSRAGRIELIKTVLSSFHVYWTSAFSIPRRGQKDIELTLRTFLWQGHSQVRRIHHIAWSTICKPLAEGGLGIKSLKDWNTGAAGVRFWDIAVKRPSLWTDWVYKRYLRNQSSWLAHPPAGSTSSWSSILKARQWIYPKVQYIIFEGKSINIWTDPWLNGQGLKRYFGRTSYIWGPPSKATLNLFMSNGKWEKPSRWPSALEHIWKDIEQIDIGGRGEDVLIWTHHKTGTLNLAAAWNYVRSSIEPPPWSSWLWKPIQTPRHSLCVWQAFHNKLPTKLRLLRKGLISDSKCPLCLYAEEDVDHLFLQCAFSRYIWSSVLKGLLIRQSFPRSLAALPNWLSRVAVFPSQKLILQLALTTIFWHIWKEHNSRSFKGQITHKQTLLKFIKLSISSRLKSAKITTTLTPDVEKLMDFFHFNVVQKIIRVKEVRWKPPEPGWLKLNTDGSLSDDRGGYGALIRNDSSGFLSGLAGRQDLPSINLLELKAIERGIWLSSQIGASKLWIESDSTTALGWIKGKGSRPWNSIRSLRNIDYGLGALEIWEATHIQREGNCPADLLASYSSEHGEFLIQPAEIWQELRDALHQDASGTIYLRSNS
ncbi:hypothetical protein QJS10_CPB15g00882 [Acorus calamus]|uniref:Reverse transcriptase domain-containing protein n=1 Tax=Acorus calamus TaxID=4465 RepID=A0AAV9D3Z2_ACOCL|nr:hypothetical protein QJS10_CPB15g00882 [Acorus calamus]